MKDWYKLGESITWDQRLQDPVRTNPRDGTRSIMQKFEMEAKARAVYVSTSAVGLLQALLTMDINGAEILGKWGNTAIGVQDQGETSLKHAATLSAEIKTEEALLLTKYKSLATDVKTTDVEPYDGTATKALRFMDEANFAFAQDDLLPLITSEPRPNIPTQVPTSSEEAKCFTSVHVTGVESPQELRRGQRIHHDGIRLGWVGI